MSRCPLTAFPESSSGCRPITDVRTGDNCSPQAPLPALTALIVCPALPAASVTGPTARAPRPAARLRAPAGPRVLRRTRLALPQIPRRVQRRRDRRTRQPGFRPMGHGSQRRAHASLTRLSRTAHSAPQTTCSVRWMTRQRPAGKAGLSRVNLRPCPDLAVVPVSRPGGMRRSRRDAGPTPHEILLPPVFFGSGSI